MLNPSVDTEARGRGIVLPPAGPPENNNATLDEFEITDLIPPATIKPKHQVIKKDKKEKNEKKSKKKKKEKIKSKKSEEESN